MTEDAPWTIGRLLQWTTTYLKDHHSDSPRLDAEVLLAHALGCQRIELYTRFEDVPAEEQRTRFRDYVRRRAQGTPVAYLVGYREFYSLRFRVTPDVLIPRPDTESLVVAALDFLKREHSNSTTAPRIADVCTGSGILAITLAHHWRAAKIDAIDISAAALAIADENATSLGVADRIAWHLGDLLAPVQDQPPFDLIVANPPYIGEHERTSLAPEVVQYEPALALFGGPEGSEIQQRLLPQAGRLLRPGGLLLIEMSPPQFATLAACAASTGLFADATALEDLARHPRVFCAQRLAS